MGIGRIQMPRPNYSAILWICDPQISTGLWLISRVLEKFMLMISPHILVAFIDKRIFRSIYSCIFFDIKNYFYACSIYTRVCTDYIDL